MTKPLNSLLQKEMSRREFLATMGFGLASVMGLSTVISMLTGKPMGGTISQNQSFGYGGGAYGGRKNGV